ncbi:MAG: 5'/3'-nucleotidase SurE [Proteobacteria bacterium]|nr:5'/3'-nucleotidase SurE [Pseudomonadota bacterium]
MPTLSPVRAACSAFATLLALLASSAPGPARALNILMCNDDGLSAANARALKQRLVAAGHSVVLSAPADNQSGTGGAISFLRAVPPLTGKERGAVDLGLAAGAPGVGQAGDDADVHYVNGSPVMACLYGLDIVAQRKWKAAPDLVISGPNEGNNTGMVNVSSGTFSNMMYAVNRGLPALAVSHASGRQVKWQADLPATHPAFEVADIAVRLVAALDAGRRPGSPLLPRGVGLNVNVPAFAEGTAKALPFRMTQIGTATEYIPAFVERLADVPAAAARGAKPGDQGITIVKGGSVLPSGSRIPADPSPDSEQNVIDQRNAVTITPVEGAPDARPANRDAVRTLLNALFEPAATPK